MQAAKQETDLDVGVPRVLYVIDDDRDLRSSLHFLLATKDVCVSPFASGVEFLSELENLQPAPIILDIRMRQMDGTEVLSELAHRQNKWPVIVLTGHAEIGIAVQSLKLGAIDFLEKPVSAAVLMTAIDTAFEQIARHAETSLCREKAAERMALLTPREAEVVDLLCQGRSNKQAAFELSISPRTVEMHRANAMRQLRVRTLIDAAALRTAASPDVS